MRFDINWSLLSRRLNLVLVLALAFGSAGCSKQARKNRYLASAERDFQAGHYDRAEIEYRAVLRIAPMDPVAVSRLGLLYFNEGKTPQAYQVLKKAVELQADNLEARAKLGFSCLALHSLKEAREQALAVLDKQPGNRDALLLLVDTAVTTNQVEEDLQKLNAVPAAAKSEAEYHLARGTIYLRRQDLTNAETEFNQAVAQEPKSSVAYLGLANFYLLRNDLKHAEPALKTAADLAPLRSIARIRYAELQLKTELASEARKSITELTEKAPDYLPAWIFLAQADWLEHKLDACSNLLQKITARDPINYDALMMSGDLFLAKGDGTNALSRFDRVAATYGQTPPVLYKFALANLANRDVNKAVVNLNQAVAANPDFAEAVLLLANLNIRKGESGQAVASLTQLLQKQPQLVQAHLLLANAYLAQKDPDSAAAVYQRMLSLFPKSPEVPLVFGAFLVQQNKKAEGRQEFEKALELNPDYLPAVESLVDLDILDKNFTAAYDRVRKARARNTGAAEPWLLLAKIHMAKVQEFLKDERDKNGPPNGTKLQLSEVPNAEPEVKAAETELLKAIALKPELRTSYLMLSQLYVMAGKQQQALENLNTLLVKTNDVIAFMQVGMIQETLKNYPAAQDAYTKLLTVNPNFSPALNNLAYLYSEHLGDLAKAYHLAERARQLLPYDPSTADTLGWILYKRGEYARALGLIEEAAARLPNSGEIQLHLGMTHYMLGEEDAARIALEQSAKSLDDFPGKSEAERRLAILGINHKTATDASISQLEEQLRRVPGDPVALGRLAAIQERDGAPDKALDTYQTALKYNPQNAQVMLNLAQIYASSRFHDLQKSLELAKNAHNLAPDSAPISALLGRLTFQTGNYQWAASLLEESIRKLPGDGQVSYDLAWAYYSLGRVSDARTAMQRAVSSSGGLDTAETEVARRFLSFVPAAQTSAADPKLVAEAEEILKGQPSYVPAIMVCAVGQEVQGNYKHAAELYDQALAIYPLFAPAARNLAILYCDRLGDDLKAYDLSLKAREAFPQDPDVAKTLGILTYRKGDFSRAAQLLREAIQTRQADGEALYYLGMAQYRLNSKTECRISLERALALNVQPNLASEAKRVLAETK